MIDAYAIKRTLDAKAEEAGVGVASILVEHVLAMEPAVTLLAVCPNSESVAAAAVSVASRRQFPLFFAATLNQVDTREGYTPWTPKTFAKWVRGECDRYADPPVVLVGLDHGGPWKKDLDYLRRILPDQAMANVQESIRSCLEAGYQLLHIDATADPFHPSATLPIELIVDRTVGLIQFAEKTRLELGVGQVSYEVGTEEVDGGLVTQERFEQFVASLRFALERVDLLRCWPCFFVADVGTNLHTTHFDDRLALALGGVVHPFGSALKGHYTDFVDAPASYPLAKMGGANIGPEFSAVEYLAVMEMATVERNVLLRGGARREGSGIETVLTEAILETGRWKKWLHADEKGRAFGELPEERQQWLLRTGSRYVWSEARVRLARGRMVETLAVEVDAEKFIVDRLENSIDAYVQAFGLAGLNHRLMAEMG